MADVASRDENNVPTLLGVSSSDGSTVVKVYADPSTHRLLVNSSGGSGTVTEVDTGTGLTGGPITTTGTISLDSKLAPIDTLGSPLQSIRVNAGATALEYYTPPAGIVTSVSVATANGFAGSSSGGTTPALTLTTSVTAPILAGNGTAISAATTTGSGSTAVLATGPTMTNPIVGTQATSDNSTKAASTAYVTTGISNAISGVNPAVAVLVATTAAGDTSALTYNNGVSGVGATLTGANNTAIAIDGHTFVIGDVGVSRILVKNDTQSPSGAFNGVYLFTALQTVGTGAIFTRALDYNSPSDINNTGAIPVVSGTVNATTSWLLTSTVNTVGTDPLTYVQFSLAPTTVVTLTGTQTLTNKRVTRRTTSVTQSATPTINSDNMDVASITGLAQAITSMTTNLSGTPVQNDFLEIQITDNGTARAISWGASFSAGGLVSLPTTTVLNVELRVLFEWDATTKWTCVAVA